MKPVIIALVGSLSQATVTRLEGEGYVVVQENMSGTVRVENKSLRDYFAAAALQGLLASDQAVACQSDTPEGIEKERTEYANQIANGAYRFADSMIKQRGLDC